MRQVPHEVLHMKMKRTLKCDVQTTRVVLTLNVDGSGITGGKLVVRSWTGGRDGEPKYPQIGMQGSNLSRVGMLEVAKTAESLIGDSIKEVVVELWAEAERKLLSEKLDALTPEQLAEIKKLLCK